LKAYDPKKLLLTLHQNLQILEERKAKQADHAPISLLNQIDDYEKAIALTKLAVEVKLSFEDLIAELKPLTLDIEGGGTTITFQGDEIVYGDKITVGNVADSVMAVGEGSVAAGKGGLAIGRVGGNLVISMGSTNITLPLFLQITVVGTAIGVFFLVVTLGSDLYRKSLPTSTPTPAPTSTSTPTPTPVKMLGNLNVAIAEFQSDPLGQAAEELKELPQSLANSIGKVAAELDESTGTTLAICPPPSGQLQNCPSHIKAIVGETPTKQAESANILANDINANVVIYGVVEVSGRRATIKPKFIVAEGYDLTLASETINPQGEYRMGLPIEISRIDLDTEKQKASRQLTRRFQVLVFIAYALNYFAVEDYPLAEKYLTKALTKALQTDEEVKTSAWEEPDVIYQMLGNIALMQSDLEKAKDNYEKALEANPAYARAQAGLGAVYYDQAIAAAAGHPADLVSQEQLDIEALRAQDIEFLKQVDLDLLDNSITAYRQALAPGMEQPPLADVSARANYGLGRAYLLKAESELVREKEEVSEWAAGQAFEKFDLVVQAYANEPNPRLKEIAAYAHGNLGYLNQLVGDYEQAVSEYHLGLLLLPGDLKRAGDEKSLYLTRLEDSCSQLESLANLSNESRDICLNLEQDTAPEAE